MRVPLGQERASGEYQGDLGRGEPEWALPKPSEPGDHLREGPQRGKVHKQEALSPEQRMVEADKRRQRRLAALARDHIVKLREEWWKLAQEWLEEYSMAHLQPSYGE